MSLVYRYTHEKTAGLTGFFSCVPDPELPLDDLLHVLDSTPFDIFLVNHLLSIFAGMGEETLIPFLGKAFAEDGSLRFPSLAALLYLRIAADPSLSNLRSHFPSSLLPTLQKACPLPLTSSAPKEGDFAAKKALLLDNSKAHKDLAKNPLFRADQELIDYGARLWANENERMAALFASFRARPKTPWEPANLSLLYRDASDALLENGFLASAEMRHEASLAPVALLREWQFDERVRQGSMDIRFLGKATAYGRGLTLAQARVSCIMEIVERASAYVGLLEDEGKAAIAFRRTPMPVIRGRFSTLTKTERVLDVHLLSPDTPFADAELAWVSVLDCSGHDIFVPAQALFLFANFNEPQLLSQGSTGLASGVSLSQAKVSALLECIERDAGATVPYLPTRVFRVDAHDPTLHALFEEYRARGIEVRFLDLTSEFAIPVYQCFVCSKEGELFSATAAKLRGRDAVLAALTETPWPYSPLAPHHEAKKTANLPPAPLRFIEDLPDYDLDNPDSNLALLEARLADFDYTPLYADISRADLGIPVVRALIPGLSTLPLEEAHAIPKRLAARLAFLATDTKHARS